MVINTGKIKKIIIVILAMFLAAVFLFDTPIKIIADELNEFSPDKYKPEELEEMISDGTFTTSSQLYISDLMIATDSSPEKAKKALHDEGFIVYDANMNEGSGTNSPFARATEYYTYIGYKLTANKEEGITGIRAMDQKGGYQEFDYRSFISNDLPGLGDLVSGMQAACAEFKKRYDAGDESAKIAKKRLDLFVVPETSKETTGKKLGDYLLDPTLESKKFEDMILILNGLIYNIINDELSMGVTSSSLKKTQAKKGYASPEDSAPSGFYTSSNGVVSYIGLTDSGTWINDAYEATKGYKPNPSWLADVLSALSSCSNLSTIGSETDSFWCDLDNRFGKEADELIKSYSEGITEQTQNYLKTLDFHLKINGTEYQSFDEFILKAPKRAIELFASKLPNVCLGGRFADIMNIFASSPKDGIPTEFTVSSDGVISYTGLFNEDFWIDLERDFGAELTLFRKAAENGDLSKEAVEYLSGISLDGTDAYTFLTKGDKDKCHAFLYSLEKQHDICQNRYFVDMLEVCASDYAHRIPTGFNLDKKYKVDWVDNVLNSINANPVNTTTEKKLYDLGMENKTEIDTFFNHLSTYMEDYKEAEKQYSRSGKSIYELFTEMEKEAREEDSDDKFSENADEQKMPYFYYITTGELLKGFVLNDGTTLFNYFSRIYDAIKPIASEDKTKTAERKAKGYALAYPVVTALTEGQRYIYKTQSFLLFLTSIIRCEFECAAIASSYRYEEKLLTDTFGPDGASVWYGTNKDLLELNSSDFLAITNSKVRQDAAQAELDSLWEKPPMYKEVEKVLITVGEIALAVVSVALSVIQIAAIVAKVTMGALFTAWWAGATIAAGAAASATIATVCTILSSVFIVIAIIVIVVLLAVLIVYGITYLVEYYTTYYSKQPTILLDSQLTINNKTEKTSIVKYYAIRDPDGKPADANAFHGKKWTTLYYTKDKRIGSPLTVGPNGEFFADQKGSLTEQEGAAPISKFGKTAPFNMNNNCYRDAIGGHYFWYYTEESMEGSAEQDENKYVSDIMITYAKTQNEARLAITRTEGYILLDIDLSPDNKKYHTYLGYKTTNRESSALTDIRVSYASASETILYGEATYSNIQSEDHRVVPATTCEEAETARSMTNFSYAVYVTKDKIAGYPILANSLEVVNSLDEISEDRDAISMFAGGPYDFNSWDMEGSGTFEKHHFLTYIGEGKKTDNDVYLAGLAFFSGTYDWGSTVEKNPTEYAKALGYSVVESLDPSEGYLNYLWFKDEYTHLAYITTRDPKRALTDIGVFTSEARSLYLPDAITCANSGYAVCQIYTQGGVFYYSDDSDESAGQYNQRIIRASHAYLTEAKGEMIDYYKDAWSFWHAQPRGLYAAGPVNGKTPIRLNDVVFSKSNLYLPRNDTKRDAIFNITDNKDLVYLNFGTGWKSVHPLDQYYYDTYDAKGNITSSFNIAAPRHPDAVSDTDNGIYIYYKNGTPDRVRGNYVSNVEIVGDHTEDASYNTARIYAMAYGTDIINLNNPIQMNSAITMDPTNGNAFYSDEDTDISGYGDGCIYVTVTYTNDMSKALGSIRILEQSTDTGALPITMNMPLETSNSMSSYQRGKSIAPYLAATEDDSTDSSKKSSSKKLQTGLVVFSTKNGFKINSLSVRTIPLAAASESTGGTNNLLGSAEYYIPFGSGSEPFRIANYPLGVAFCLCADRHDDADASAIEANFKYIESIAVITDKSFDGSVGMAAAKLGASQYPFVINCDIAEGALRSGDNRVVAIGVKRTGNAREAIKDIKISAVDYGVSFEYLGRSYARENDIPVNGMFIYTTKDDGTKELLSEYIDWRTINLETTNLAKFDFTKLNWLTIDKTFQYKWVDQSDPDIIAVQDYQYTIEKAFAPELSAITNLGFVPWGNADGSQDGVFWAGRASKNGAQTVAPVTSKTSVLNVQSFDGTTPGMKLVYTNGANKDYDDFVIEAKKNLPSLTGSIFADLDQIWVIVTLSAVSLAAVAVAVFVSRKRKKKV